MQRMVRALLRWRGYPSLCARASNVVKSIRGASEPGNHDVTTYNCFDLSRSSTPVKTIFLVDLPLPGFEMCSTSSDKTMCILLDVTTWRSPR